MSQHQIHVDSPRLGRVHVTIGYDPMLDEAFLNYFNDSTSYMSPSGLVVGELGTLAVEQLGRPLPQQVLDAVQNDVADLRMGATDIGRRVTCYEDDGNPVDQRSSSMGSVQCTRATRER